MASTSWLMLTFDTGGEFPREIPRMADHAAGVNLAGEFATSITFQEALKAIRRDQVLQRDAHGVVEQAQLGQSEHDHVLGHHN